jgi:hypothetical protein
MHGMLSSAIILIAFALAAGAGGYVTLSLYRATPGAPRSGPGPEEGEPEQAEAAEPDDAAQPDDAAGPAEPADPDGGEGARVYVLRQPPV